MPAIGARLRRWFPGKQRFTEGVAGRPRRGFQPQRIVGLEERALLSGLAASPNEIVAEGESAGANLAALLGVYSIASTGTGVSSSVEAVVAVSTPTDLTALYREKQFAGSAAAEFLGGSPGQVPANYIAASPLDQVAPGDPPMLLIHGRQDGVIPVSQSEKVSAALTKAGVPNELLLVHGGHGLDFPTHYSNLVPGVLAFLEATWTGQHDLALD
jgi:acetyl esterase/lipase